MPDPAALRRHCAQIDQCNQRGGRMLSILDLLAAGTFTPDLAAYALAALRRGASFLTGALPGGAGKTTIMGALLNFLPADVELAVADSLASIRHSQAHPAPRRCYLCHEIGPGHYYAYLWGEALRAYFALAPAGHLLATNLHADTYAQAHAQICHDNGVPETHFRQIHLLFFIAVPRSPTGTQRRIAAIWESDGAQPHRPIYPAPGAAGLAPSALVTPADLAAARATLDMLRATDRRTIEAVRAFLLDTGAV